MKSTRLGKTNLSVSRIAFGGIPIQRLSKENDIPLMTNIPSFWKRFPPEALQKFSFDKVVEVAKTCTQCGQCEERCPCKLPIREMLTENIAFYEQQTAL